MKRKSRTILALSTVIITTVMLWYTNRTEIPKDASWDDVKAEAQAGGYKLINIDELWARYQSKQDTPLLVDTRQEWEYRSGHMKGAVNFPIQPTWLSRWRKRGELERLLGDDRDRFIVFY